MSNHDHASPVYYGAGLPPALVTVENGFSFHGDNDSDISSLNTTPSKDAQKTIHRFSREDIDEADVGLKFSKANSSQAFPAPGLDDTRMKKNPPMSVVQVDSNGATSKANATPASSTILSTPPPDPRVAHDPQENSRSRSISRDQVLQDRKEKYRQMASAASGKRALQGTSWKKKANQRLSEKVAEERAMAWYIPDDEGDDPYNDNSPIKATTLGKSFDEQQLQGGQQDGSSNNPETLNEEKSLKPTPAPSEVSKEELDTSGRMERAIVAKSKAFSQEDDTLATQVDVYGCPIFSVVESLTDNNKEEEAIKAKLDELDAKLEKEKLGNKEKEALTSMLSSASSFLAAQNFSEESAKLLDGSVQAMEDMLLGPVDEGIEECDTTNSDDSSADASSADDSSDGPPPPPPQESPPSTMSAFTKTSSPARSSTSQVVPSPARSASSQKGSWSSAGSTPTRNAASTTTPPRRSTNNQELNSALLYTNAASPGRTSIDTSPETSFVLDDDSDVDVTHVLEATYVLDDLASLEKFGGKSENDDYSSEKSNEESTSGNATVESSQREGEHGNVTINEDSVYMDLPTDNNNNNNKESKNLQNDPLSLKEKKAKAGDIITPATPDVAPERKRQSPRGVAPDSFDDASKQGAMTNKGAVEVKECAPSRSFDDAPTSCDVAAAVVANLADAAAMVGKLAAPVTKPAVEGDSKQPKGLIIVQKAPQTKAGEPEFPPTDDNDLEFDMSSVRTGKTASSDQTPVRGNLDASKFVGTKTVRRRAPASNGVAPDVVSVRSVRDKKKGVATTTSKTKMAATKSATGASIIKDLSTAGSATSTKSIQKLKTQPAQKKIPVVKADPVKSAKPREKAKPAMMKTLDDNNGIAKGDIVISLLNPDLNGANSAPKGADQIRDAISRMRAMRRRQENAAIANYEPEEHEKVDSSPSKRSVVPVDVDDMRVVDGFGHVKTLEEEAIEHLKRDEIDAAIELYGEIMVIYSESFKPNGDSPERNASTKAQKDQTGHKSYFGAAYHNIGILHLLKSDFENALVHFTQAASSRKDQFGAGSVDHLASLNKIALCHFAMDEFEEAHRDLEEVLELSKNHLAGLSDFSQIAEVLNNLGCLSFMCGQSDAAMMMFQECLDVQSAVLKRSLYGGPRWSGQSTSLSISVTRGNIGYIKMLSKSAEAAIVEFEASLMHQQMILCDTHDTLICTMDHLAVANLLENRKNEAMKMLSRMLRAQIDAYGPDHELCVLTLGKLQLVQTQDTGFLGKALEQLRSQHTASSTASKSAKTATGKKSKKVLKKLSFSKKAAKLSENQ